MTGRLIATICVLILLLNVPLLSQQYYEIDVNIDLENGGPFDAYGLDIVFRYSNNLSVTGHYDGNPDNIGYGWFANFTWSTDPVTHETWLEWRDFRNGSDNIIEPGDAIHVGYRIRCIGGEFWYANWTDEDEEQIPNCHVCNLTPRWEHNPMKVLSLTWDGYSHGKSLCQSPISVSNAVYAVLDSPVHLDSLNAHNAALAAMLDSLPGGGNFTVLPDSHVTRDISGVPEGTWVVLRYELTTPEVTTLVTDYVQIYVSPPAAIPTLTEWGLIVFGVALLGFISWVFLRSRRVGGIRV